MAREGREQDRLADTYVKMLVFVRHMSDWAQSVRLRDRAAESTPSLDLYTEVMAAVTAFGSDAARNALDEWMTVIWNMIKTDKVIDLKQEARERNELAHVDFQNPELKLEDLRRDERRTRSALVEQVRDELRQADTREE
jgi:hypothetical protein